MSATFVALAGLLIALIASAFAAWQATLLRIQLKYQNRVNSATFYQNMSRATTEFDRTFVTHPELRPYFYGNKVCDDPARQQALGLAACLADAAEVCVAAEEFMPHLRGDWDDYFGFIYRHSPVLREYWGEFGYLYPPDVKRTFLGPSLRPKVRTTRPAVSGDDRVTRYDKPPVLSD
jgi:hypothetical protein